MKNKLWVFGDSLSTGYNPFLIETPDFCYDSSITWPELLADKLNLECINKSIVGASNYKIRSVFYKTALFENISKGDTIIFQFTFVDRINFEPGALSIHKLNEIGTTTIHELITNEYYEMWNYFYNEFSQFCISNGINYYIWVSEENKIPLHLTHENCFIRLNHNNKIIFGLYENWIEKTPKFWIKSNDGKIDRHLNEIGHASLYELIYDFIYEK